ncbi:maleylacetoacetate isomerase [Maritimibacter dapengensis]|uniref:Maleylacetoacetate isomerase n=1 Tax=Maritimibacter dapengensis TaxID=2836868 RepID=A0ABS6T3F1_9RHOB|nr:maleylacetoacetate isomerase [Maritimibacter dapengensis]MBV7379791.1 maleylacetoacetate isomerase [Maritimibacter dapengensis]
MKLYTYWRSTTSYRVRIALNLKGVDYTSVPVDLVAGDQRSDAYAGVNPGLGVPALVLDDGTTLTQSMAILDWLEDTHPEPALLPTDPIERAHARAAALGIATDIHPVNNLRVVGRLKSMGHTQDEAIDWMNHWMTEGFAAFQTLIRPDTPFCFGDTPGLADICLVPQLYNARRWGTDLAPFARLTEIEGRCLALPAFDAARPEAQADAT